MAELEELAAERRRLTKLIGQARAQVRRHDTNARLARIRAQDEARWAIEARSAVSIGTFRREQIVRRIEELKNA